MSNLENFDVKTVKLAGNNTIEASAGTGKTYSLAVLVVRLLLEKQMPIEHILLVTFTEAAAAELKERTAKFIRLALKEVDEKGSSEDKTIEAIVHKPEIKDIDKKALLRQALLDLDKATMATIHSFCQQTLTEFAFETGQSFGKELIKDLDTIIQYEVAGYMRSSAYQQNYGFLKELGISGSSYFTETVKNKLNGLEFVKMMEAESFEKLENLENSKINEVTGIFDQRLKHYKEEVEKTAIPRFPKTQTLESLSSSKSFYEYLFKTTSKNVPLLFPDEIKMVKENQKELSNIKKYVAHYQLNKAAEIILPQVLDRLQQKNALTFNDLIDSLYQKREHPELIRLMREKYKAVFVDEFQDTDPKQYGIFKSFFQDDANTGLFFIGDPKQSIYGWRQADIETYKQARDSANMKKLEMNTNYRSSASFIDAANAFFKLDEQSKLDYIEVKSNEENQKAGLTHDGKSLPTIQLLEGKEKPTEFTQKVFTRLFDTRTQLNKKPVSPENVAVLVRSGYEATETKRILNKLKIPSVVISDINVFTTQEAKNLKTILNAVLNINQGNVYYALITSLVGKEIDDLKQVDEDAVFPIFYGCQAVWKKDGISKMMANFMQAFNVISNHSKDIIKGHQILANTKQLIDILQKQTTEHALTPSEAYHFLSEQIKNPDTNNEAYQQTVENDEKAVKIMTIHKSKGLEFDVVVLPYLNLNIQEKGIFTTFRNEGNYYFTLKGTEGEPISLYNAQVKQEDERLLYVAVTRAKYTAFIFGKNGDHLLTPYIKKLSSNTDITSKFSLLPLETYADETNMNGLSLVRGNNAAQTQLKLGDLQLADKNYHKMSYSFLASKHQHHRKEETATPEENTYEHFIFKECCTICLNSQTLLTMSDGRII
jgi:exodeoxyribonuclease V beta subunit